MVRKVALIMALTAWSFAGPALAEREAAIKTGNDLIAACRSTGWENGYCYGYILGVYRGLETLSSIWNKPVLCGTEDATVEQAMLVVLKHLRSNPKQMSQASEYGVITALMDAFPCK